MSACVLAAAAAALFLPGVAHAAPPANDDFDASTAITALPFTAQQVLTEATKAIDDPLSCGGFSTTRSVWFHHTASEDGFLRLSSAGGAHNASIVAFTGVRGDLREITNGCSNYAARPATIAVKAGTTYHFMVSNPESAGLTKLTVERRTKPANDDFAAAQPISSLPFSTPDPDYATASYQPDEPVASDCLAAEGDSTVWYSYTPQQTQSVLAQVKSPDFSGPVAAIWAGTSLSDLRLLGCGSGAPDGGGAVRLTAGTTYYLQISGRPQGYVRPSTVTLEEAPPLEATLFTSGPAEPTIYDTVTFLVSLHNTFGPTTTEWDFGDGTTTPAHPDQFHYHRYTADGDYQVTSRTTTADGRTDTETITVKVRTHDVGITRFAVPTSARAGQQKPITVTVANTGLLERATVTLYRHDGAWAEVGRLTLDVPAHPTRKVDFPFSYTFTPQDAVVGRVTFRAVVELPYPDARPADNEVVAVATTVHPTPAVTARID